MELQARYYTQLTTKKIPWELVLVTQACNPSYSRYLRQDNHVFKACMLFRVSLGLAWATLRDPISKSKPKSLEGGFWISFSACLIYAESQVHALVLLKNTQNKHMQTHTQKNSHFLTISSVLKFKAV